MSAERERGGSAAPATPLRALLSALLLLLLAGPTAAAPAAAAPSAVPAPSTSATLATTSDVASASGLQLTVAPLGSGIVEPDSPLAVRVVATNLSTAATPAGTVTLAVAAVAPADSATLVSWFGESDADVRPVPVATAAIASLEPGSSTAVELRVEPAAAGFAGAWGPRVIEVAAEGEGRVLGAARSAVVWVPEGTTPPTATVVAAVPLTAPGFEGAVIPAEDLAVLTAPGGLLVRTLDAVAGRAVAIGVDPRIIASIRILGTTAPESATAFLDRLALVPNDTFALAWADADPLATAHARGIPLPPVEGAGAALDPSVLSTDPSGGGDGGDPSPSAAPGDPDASPSATPDPGDEPPTLAELSAWPHDLTDIVWPQEGTATASALGVLAASGVRTAIVGSANLDGGRGLVARVGDLRILRSDDALSRAARAAVAATTEQEWQSAAAQVSALIAASSAADASVVPFITLDRERLGNSLRLLDLLGAIEALPWARGGGLATASAASGPEVGVVDATISEERLVDVGRMLDAETLDRAFAEVAVQPSLITDERRLELLAALSLGWDEEAPAAADRYVEASADLRSSVQIVEGSTITLLSDRTSLPVTVQNALDVAIRVFVRVDSSTGRLLVEDRRVETIVEPQSQTRALVPVQSLTNGEVPITVSLSDAADRTVGQPTSVLLNLQAGWETAAIVVMAVLVGGLLAFGLSRDIRRRLRARRGEEEAA
ncbi:DUF6049 family protein [Yonghaparkia sp. Soil809]|uniref:DUF6049 family protein n=1 Tax=Yonghaparkia sp. Soil809 TaxID=1736417 RepID=UPI0006F89EA2|nr:DUF6049 family protein [Yonghaparkia sp. Soil809]KRF33289.1 hypothetical protein ASG83_04905 [Yonghaparkia sp. Soil809]